MANELTFTQDLEVSLKNVEQSLPANVDINRFVHNSFAVLTENKQLTDFATKYGTQQIKEGLLKGCFLGLDFMFKEAYLIPYGNQLNFIIDYRGNVKLCKQYSTRKIKEIYAKCVKEGDTFEAGIENGQPTISYKQLPFNDGKVIGAFAVCLYEDGGMVYDTMSIKDLENTRSASKAKNSPAWTKFPEEMYKKTVLHRLCKHIPLEFRNKEQYNYFNEDMQVETDHKKIMENEVKSNANIIDFEEM